MSESGLESRLIEVLLDSFPVEIELYRLPADASRWRVVVRDEAPAADPAGAVRVAPLLSLAANPLDAAGCPEGWVVSDGWTVQPLDRKGRAALVVRNDGRFMLGRVRDLIVRPEFVGGEVTQAFQGGDLIVMEGLPFPSLTAGLAYRSFLALDADERIVVGATRAPVHAGELAEVLAQRAPGGGAGLKRVIQLQQGTCTWLSVAGDAAAEGCPPLTPPAVLLTVEAAAAHP